MYKHEVTALSPGVESTGVLEKIQYNLWAIIDTLHDNGVKPSLNTIFAEVFKAGIDDLSKHISARIGELEDFGDRAAVEELQMLNPVNDVVYSCNDWDARIFIVNHEETYRRWMDREIRKVETKMGFCFL